MLPATELVEQDCPCAEDAALDRANSTTADPSRLVVRQSGNSNQEECFSLAGGHEPQEGDDMTLQHTMHQTDAATGVALVQPAALMKAILFA